MAVVVLIRMVSDGDNDDGGSDDDVNNEDDSGDKCYIGDDDNDGGDDNNDGDYAINDDGHEMTTSDIITANGLRYTTCSNSSFLLSAVITSHKTVLERTFHPILFIKKKRIIIK